MKLLIPPVIQVVVSAGAMWLIDRNFPSFDFSFDRQTLFSSALLATGLIVSFIAVGGFRKAKTTVNPTAPSQTNNLVTDGIYSFTRNPMYLGFLVILGGWAVELGNFAAIGVLPVFTWYMSVFQIKPEEQALKEKFGADYEAYCKKVRRWI